MLAELGQWVLILALLTALPLAVVPLLGSWWRLEGWMRFADRATRVQFVLVSLSFAILTTLFLQSDFSVSYVANNSNTLLPWYYRISAVWGAHEGSLLLWVLILCSWSVAISLAGRELPLDFRARVLAIMGWVSTGFLSFIVFTSNPFLRLFPVPTEGRDLNPLLQDPGLVIHPPMLYMGYVGFSVAFAFAVAGLLDGRLDSRWVRWARPWTNAAWAALTGGIVLGSWWAYYELGWGGWWFWDPVENASFMPWLAGTALLHSLAVTEKRKLFTSWTVLLAIITFSLSLLGTFLVRSGVLTSVHAFASDPSRGLFILVFLAVMAGGALTLYALRAPRLVNRQPFELFSRETAILAGNILLVLAMLVVLVGTLYPLVIDLVGAGKISVGPPYFHTVFPIVLFPLVLLMPMGPFTRWKKDQAERMLPLLWPGLALAALILLAFVVQMHTFSAYGLLAAAGGAWVAGGTLNYFWQRQKKSRQRILGVGQMPSGVVGMVLAHLGVGLFLLGVAMTESQSIERDLRMAPGQSTELAGYRFTFQGAMHSVGPNYEADQGTVVVSHKGREIAILHPQKRMYLSGGKPMTEAAIDAGITRDIYVAMGEPLGNDGAWAIRLYYKPYIRWIWLGGLLMMIGGLVAATDRRFRIAEQAVALRDRKLALQES